MTIKLPAYDTQRPNFQSTDFKYNNFYDIESIPNIFTCSIFYPTLKRLDIFYSVDDPQLIDNQMIAKRIREVNPELNDSQIYFYNLDSIEDLLLFTLRFQYGKYYNEKIGTNRACIYDKTTNTIDVKNNQRFYPINDVVLNNFLIKKTPQNIKTTDFKDQYMKQHRIQMTQHMQNNPARYQNFSYENFWGFNSRNYDLTMISALLANIDENNLIDDQHHKFKSFYDLQATVFDHWAATGNFQTPSFSHNLYKNNQKAFEVMYNTNTQLFSEDYKGHMISYVFQNHDVQPFYNNLHYSNRFNDICDHTGLQVSLKNRASALGRTIKESDILGTGESLHQPIQMAELCAYNVCDVLNTAACFGSRACKTTIDDKRTVLNMFPVNIFNRNNDMRGDQKPTSQEKLQNLQNIDNRRLTLDDTSAQYATRTIAPYKPLTDTLCVDFAFPRTILNPEDEVEAKRYANQIYNWRQAHESQLKQEAYFYEEDGEAESLAEKNEKAQLTSSRIVNSYAFNNQYNGIAYDALDETMYWFAQKDKEYPNAHLTAAFRPIYQMFNRIRGKNVNDSKQQRELLKNEKNITTDMDLKQFVLQYRDKLFYIYRDEHGNPTNAYANIQLGGVHGAEYNKLQYDVDRIFYQHHDELKEILTSQLVEYKKKYGNTKEIYLQNPTLDLNPVVDMQVPARYLINKSGHLKPVNAKFGNPNVQISEIILDNKGKVRDTYKYVSDNLPDGLIVFHVDVTSFYPTMLSLENAYATNESYQGKEIKVNRYLTVYQTRVKIKKAWKSGIALDGVTKLTDELKKSYEASSNGYKLILNSASGRSDESRDNNIRMNNLLLSMRLTGELFALRLGQALAFKGCRIPSTNTDGLYVYVNPNDPNPNHVHNQQEVQQVVDETIKHMLIKVDAEPIDRFVSKDTNNRIEYHHPKGTNEFATEIEDARGADLTSYRDIRQDKKPNKPPLNDQILVEYIQQIKSPSHPFDPELIKQIFINKFNEAKAYDQKHHSTDARRYLLNRLAWTTRGNEYRLTFLNYMQPIYQFFDYEKDNASLSKRDRAMLNQFKPVLDQNGYPKIKPLQRINRILLTKFPTDGSAFTTLNMVNKTTANMKDTHARQQSLHPSNPWENFAFYVMQQGYHNSPKFQRDIESFRESSSHPYFRISKYAKMPSPTFSRPSELKRKGLDYEMINIAENAKYAQLEQVIQNGIENGIDVINPYWTQPFSTQPVKLVNQNFAELTDTELNNLIDSLDFDAYTETLQETVNNWSN